MIERRSPATSKHYTLNQLTRVWRFACSSFYESKKRLKENILQRRRGPLGAGSDEDLIKEIKLVLDSSDFIGEGYRKVWLRLRLQGVRTSKERVHRLMRETSLQASSPSSA